MLLCEFIVFEKDLIEKFQDYWMMENKKDPIGFPINLNHSDWFEQLILFAENIME